MESFIKFQALCGVFLLFCTYLLVISLFFFIDASDVFLLLLPMKNLNIVQE